MPGRDSDKTRTIVLAGWLAGGLAFLAWPPLVAGWSLAIEQSTVGMALPDIHAGAWQITGSRASVSPSVTASGVSATFDFEPPSHVTTDRLVFSGAREPLVLSDLRAELGRTRLTVDYGATGPVTERLAIEGKISVAASRVEHPLLTTQAWHFDGTVEGRLANLEIRGTLVSAAGLEVELDATIDRDEGVSVAVETAILGQQDLTVLKETLASWPEMLSVDTGDVRLSANILIAPDGEFNVSGTGEFEGVSGILNRTAINGVTGRVRGSLADARITVGLRDLRIDQINPGIPVSSVRLTGDYAAPVSRWRNGRLDVQQARARFLEGTLRIPPGTYDLSGDTGTVPIELQQISLGQLLQVYPAEGLSGSGLLSGRIPLAIDGDGVEVTGGQISAIDPGGRVQLPADKLQAMLGGSQAMDLVVQALQNFHYSVLRSTIDYDEQGTLTLGLRLEGRSPALQGGQPVILNVNLEEDIPALLTSLQLSGRVNEAVTERVRKLLQQSSEETAK